MLCDEYQSQPNLDNQGDHFQNVDMETVGVFRIDDGCLLLEPFHSKTAVKEIISMKEPHKASEHTGISPSTKSGITTSIGMTLRCRLAS